MSKNSSLRTLGGHPLLGSVLEFRRDRIGLQRRLARELGDIGWFRMGPIKVLTLAGPELIRAVLVEHAYAFVKSRGLRELGRPILGAGLLTAEGDAHKRQRKLLAPAFQHKRIARYADVMAGEAERAQARFADGAALDLAEELMTLTLTIVGKTLFDTDVTAEAPRIGQAVTDAMEAMVDGVSSPPLPYSWPIARHRKMKRAVTAMDELVYPLIHQRRGETNDRGDVLSMLLAARDEDGAGLDDCQIRDEVLTLMAAGHETTANALSWTFHLLLDHPAAAARLEAEIDGALAGRTPTMEDLPKLPFALAVVKESMRLYPPAYVVGRRALGDVPIGDYLVPEGKMVMINIFGMHHRADLFPDPERFQPERFLGEAEKSLPRGAYLPFSDGARVCIGNHFALMEAHLLVATLSQRVRFVRRGPSEIAPDPLVTLRPRGGLPVRVVRRDRAVSSAA